MFSSYGNWSRLKMSFVLADNIDMHSTMCVACRHIRVCAETYISYVNVVLVISTQPSLGKLVKKEKAKKSVVVLVANFCYFAPHQRNKFRIFLNFRKQVSFQCETWFSQKYILTFVILLLLLLLVWEVRTEN
jgi:hypothetical protein